jgi:RNA polymerase sigma-70 factor (ECF subfamily)
MAAIVRPIQEKAPRPMDAENDAALIAGAQAGNRQALESLVARHYATMFRIAYRWCRNREDAEDVTQEACVALARGIFGFQGRAQFSTWLYQLVLNAARDQRRRSRRQHQCDDPAATGDCPLSADPDPEQRLYLQRVLAEVEALPDQEREAMLLVHGEGLSHGEAGRIAGCAETTISWRIHNARKRLKRALRQGRNPHGHR